MRKVAWCALVAALPAYPQAFDWQQRVQHYVHRTYSWQRLTLLAVDTSIDHLFDEPREWGRAPASFSYRYSAGFGRRVVRNSIELGVGAALHEDTRFQPSQGRSFLGRVRHAATNAFLTSGEHPRLAYSRLAATTGGILIASHWYPRPLTVPLFFEGLGFGVLGHLQNSFLTEFSPDMKAFGKRVSRKIRRQPRP